MKRQQNKLSGIGAFLGVLFFAAYALAMAYSVSSGERTADAVIYGARCYLTGVELITDGTNPATLILYNGQDASGGVLTKVAEFVVAGEDNYGGRNFNMPLYCDAGLYADVAGTGASYIVDYGPR